MLSGFQFPHGLLSLTSLPPKKRWTKASFNTYHQTDNPLQEKITFSLHYSSKKRNTLCKQTAIKQQKMGGFLKWRGLNFSILIVFTTCRQFFFWFSCIIASLHHNNYYSRGRIPDVTKNSYWKGGFFHYQTNTQINTVSAMNLRK